MKTPRDVEIKVNGDDFILVTAGSLSMKDEFMSYSPVTGTEREVKELISEAIRKGVKDFYCPKYAPSFGGYIRKHPYLPKVISIRFVPGKRPFVGQSYSWWKDVAKEYSPEHNSHLGTRLEYYAFLGVLIKKIVREGRSIKWAWNAVCNDPYGLGDYEKPKMAKYTGYRRICGFYDLSIACKILSADIDKFGYGFWVVDDSLCGFANIYNSFYCNKPMYDSVGWIVLDA